MGATAPANDKTAALILMPSHNRTVQGLLAAGLLLIGFAVRTPSQSPADSAHFEKDGLTFDYGSTWELSEQSNPTAQQLVLLEKDLDAQIMIIALRSSLTNAKQEEEAKTALIEPSISRLLKQYEDAGIKVERASLTIDINGVMTEGAQLRFAVDGQPGITDVCWLVINQRLVQLFFMRPEKNATKAAIYWDTVRSTLRIQKLSKVSSEAMSLLAITEDGQTVDICTMRTHSSPR